MSRKKVLFSYALRKIASAMLQRQASAILSARQIIVDGAVGMVQMAIARLESEGLHLDEERKAAMD